MYCLVLELVFGKTTTILMAVIDGYLHYLARSPENFVGAKICCLHAFTGSTAFGLWRRYF